MKRILAWVLVLVMVLGAFAGCSNNDTPETTNKPTTGTTVKPLPNGAADAIEYLKALYKDDGSITGVDYERFAIVRIAGVAYNVVWTTDAGDQIKVTPKDDLTVTVDIDETNKQEKEYNLIATVTDDAGHTSSWSWKHIMPAAVDQTAIVEEAYKLAAGAAMDRQVTLTGKIIAVNTAYDSSYKNVTVTIEVEGAEDKPIMCYRLKGDGADLIKNGWIITVTGTIKNYNGTIEFDAGCTLDKYIEGEGVTAPTDPKQIVDEAYALEDGKSLPYDATLTGKIISIDTGYSADYKNITVTIAVEGSEDKPVMCYRMKGEGAEELCVGDTITVTGLIKNYKGTIEFDTGCQLKDVVPGERIKAPEDPMEILKAAYALKQGEKLPYEVTLTGIITSVDTPYSDEYDNITVTITREEAKSKPITCFRMKGEGVDTLWGSDVITVKGYIVNYEGTIEFEAGCQLVEIVEKGKGYAAPADMDKVIEDIFSLPPTCSLLYRPTLTGKVVKINTSYSAEYDNITVTIELEDSKGKSYELKIYRMSGTDADKIAKGDTITVKGNVTHYKNWEKDYSELEMVNGTLLKLVKNETPAGDASYPVASETLEIGAAYKLVLIQPNVESVLVFSGAMDGSYLATTTDAAKYVDVYAEAAEGGYRFYFMDGTAKKYIEIFLNSNNKPRPEITDTPDAVWTYDAASKLYVVALNDGKYTNNYYLGTYNDYKTISASDAYYISGDKASAYGESQFAAILMKEVPTWDFGEKEEPFVKPTTPKEIVDAAYALDSGDTLAEGPYTLTGVITKVGTYNTQYKDVTVVIVVDGMTDKPIECYALKGEGNDALKVGDTITVTGNIKNFNGTIEFDKPNLDSVNGSGSGNEGGETTELVPSIPANTTTLTYDFASFTHDGKQSSTQYAEEAFKLSNGAVLKVVGCHVRGDYGELRIYSSASYDGNAILNFGLPIASIKLTMCNKTDVMNVYGSTDGATWKLVKGVEVTSSGYSDADKAEYTVEMPAGTEYTQLKLDVAGTNQLRVNAFTVNFGTATGEGGETGGDDNGSDNEGGETPVAPSDPKQIVDAAFALAEGEKLAYEAELTGVITKINDAYSSQYGNISVTIEVEGTKGKQYLLCFRLTGTDSAALADLAVTDTITVTGNIKNHYGTIEFAEGCKLGTVVKGEGVQVDANTKTYKFADYIAGTQYAKNEVHELDQNITVTTDAAHFTTQLRLYSSTSNNSTAVIQSTKNNAIKKFAFSAGNKVDTLIVYGSTDGTEWTVVKEVSITATSYNPYEVDLSASDYTYLKLDVKGSNQIRIEDMTITFANVPV